MDAEQIALSLLKLAVTVLPPLAELLARYLPQKGEDSLADRVREVLPADGASAAAQRKLELEAGGAR